MMEETFPLECAQDANTLRRMKKADLIELARGYGLDQGGLKETLVQRISEWATRQVWLQSTGQQEAMDCVPEEKITQPEPGALKRIASSFGLGPLTTNSQPQAQSEDTSMHVPASASPESNYTRRYSFLPEDSMDSFDEQEGNESTTKSVDSRPAIRSIPSKSSMEIDRQSQANMLLDDQVDTARATAVFGSSKSSTLPNQTMAFGSRALAEQEFSFQSPAAAPKMPPVPSISSFFQTFMGTEKSHKPDRFAAAHEYQFSKMQSITDCSRNGQQKRKREEEPGQPVGRTDSSCSKRSLMSRSFESLRGKAKSINHPASPSFVNHKDHMTTDTSELAQLKKRKSVAMEDNVETSQPKATAAQLRRRFLNKQKARRRSSVPGEQRKKAHQSATAAFKASFKASNRTFNSKLPGYAHPTTAFQAKSHNVPQHKWTSSHSAKVKGSMMPLQAQPPMHPRFGVSHPPKESNGAVIIGFAKPHQTAANGGPATSRENVEPRFASGTASSRAKAVESPNKRQRFNTDKPMPVTPARRANNKLRGVPTRSRITPRKAAVANTLSARRPAPFVFSTYP